MEIIPEDNGKKGVFKAVEDGREAGLMTYTWAGTNKFIIDHTEVDDAFAGRGVGKKLVFAGVDFARKKGVKILPLCPFAKALFDKIDAIKDVLF